MYSCFSALLTVTTFAHSFPFSNLSTLGDPSSLDLMNLTYRTQGDNNKKFLFTHTHRKRSELNWALINSLLPQDDWSLLMVLLRFSVLPQARIELCLCVAIPLPDVENLVNLALYQHLFNFPLLNGKISSICKLQMIKLDFVHIINFPFRRARLHFGSRCHLGVWLLRNPESKFSE